MGVGVIVGRFQVDTLHEGHRFLINTALSHNRKVIVFIGIAPEEYTVDNPLPFEARKRMVELAFPDVICLPIKDQPGDDEGWSTKLDELVCWVADPTKVTLYSGRDGFIKYYKGNFQNHVIVESDIDYVNASGRRSEIGKVLRGSEDFRAGLIHATQNVIRGKKISFLFEITKVGANGATYQVVNQDGSDLWFAAETFDSYWPQVLVDFTGIIGKNCKVETVYSYPEKIIIVISATYRSGGNFSEKYDWSHVSDGPNDPK